MTDRGGGASLLPYTPAGLTGSDDAIELEAKTNHSCGAWF